MHAVPMETSFNPGLNVTLKCQIVGGGPADTIQWYKDDQPINIQKQFSSSQWSEMTLINITKADSGEYKCTVWKKEENDSDVFDLHVNGNCVQMLIF